MFTLSAHIYDRLAICSSQEHNNKKSAVKKKMPEKKAVVWRWVDEQRTTVGHWSIRVEWQCESENDNS